MPNNSDGLSKFKEIARKKPKLLYLYAMDWSRHNPPLTNAVALWEAREPGSLKGVLDAYSTVLNKLEGKKHFSLSDVIDIQKICVTTVKHTDDNSTPKSNLRETECSFGINGSNFSDSGFLNAIKKCYESKDYERITFMNTKTNPIKQLIEALSLSEDCTWDKFISTAQVQETLLSMRDANLLEYNGLSNSNGTLLEEVIEKELKTFYEKINTAETDDQKLELIIKLVQTLEQVHPFEDCNCRTFCMVLLNSLLMQYGFSPAILENPNRFDGYTIEELKEDVRKGMLLTDQLHGYADGKDADIYLRIEQRDNRFQQETTCHAQMLTNEIKSIDLINHDVVVVDTPTQPETVPLKDAKEKINTRSAMPQSSKENSTARNISVFQKMKSFMQELKSNNTSNSGLNSSPKSKSSPHI